MQMRSRVGDKAMDIAKDIDDLVIDETSGRVLTIKKSPAKIIALLILKYEKLLGQRVSFMFRKPDPLRRISSEASDETKNRLATVDKNLIVVRKYFE